MQSSFVDELPPVQLYPHSTEHVPEQPSPATVFLSSHCSLPALKPSPHVVEQFDSAQGTREHVQPDSTARQSALHPSPPTVLPSSHVSLPASLPSPHVVLQVSRDVGLPPVQLYPHSVWQLLEQPSSFFEFPSSQDSGSVRSPSPQILGLGVVVGSGVVLLVVGTGVVDVVRGMVVVVQFG